MTDLLAFSRAKTTPFDLGGRMKVYDEQDIEMVADVATEMGMSAACLLRACEEE
jgi:hypothetical protein